MGEWVYVTGTGASTTVPAQADAARRRATTEGPYGRNQANRTPERSWRARSHRREPRAARLDGISRPPDRQMQFTEGSARGARSKWPTTAPLEQVRKPGAAKTNMTA